MKSASVSRSKSSSSESGGELMPLRIVSSLGFLKLKPTFNELFPFKVAPNDFTSYEKNKAFGSEASDCGMRPWLKLEPSVSGNDVMLIRGAVFVVSPVKIVGLNSNFCIISKPRT